MCAEADTCSDAGAGEVKPEEGRETLLQGGRRLSSSFVSDLGKGRWAKTSSQELVKLEQKSYTDGGGG